MALVNLTRLDFHTKYLIISRELGDRAGEGTASGNLGAAFHCLEKFDKAIEFHNKHLNFFDVQKLSWGTGLERARRLATWVLCSVALVNLSRRPNSTTNISIFPVSWETRLGNNSPNVDSLPVVDA